MRYNEYTSAQVNATAAAGVSSQQAMKVMEDVFAQTMPREMGFDYLGMSFQEQKAAKRVPAGSGIRDFAPVCFLDSGRPV